METAAGKVTPIGFGMLIGLMPVALAGVALLIGFDPLPPEIG